ncbi:phage protein Gp36 family protein [Prevotella sp. AGR2160]|uniref:phage protein Gp36 family protein n=1 Tax=Prevotella sp. AGR2160 TaxID=1280674 RepID=UPI00048FDC7E|nr:phage protein Gp36 family protein [Prevotella sp. AGR2160]
MFITDEDYRVVIGDSALKVVSQTSDENRSNAEAEAQEEIASYLRPVYDCKSIFSAEGAARNRLIVMYTCDIALYHMVSAMPQKLGSEIRKERYERAVKWLEGVQAGKIVPDLPLTVNEDGETVSPGIILSSQKPLRHNW